MKKSNVDMVVESVEDMVGMGQSAWDMVEPKDLILACYETIVNLFPEKVMRDAADCVDRAPKMKGSDITAENLRRIADFWEARC